MNLRAFLRLFVIFALLESDLGRLRVQAACAECMMEHQAVSATKTKHAFQEFKSSGDTNEVKMFLKLTRLYTLSTSSSVTGDVQEGSGACSGTYSKTTNNSSSTLSKNFTETKTTTLTDPTEVATYSGSSSSSDSSSMTGEDQIAAANCCSRVTKKTNETATASSTGSVIILTNAPYWAVSSTNASVSHYSVYYDGCYGATYTPHSITNTQAGSSTNAINVSTWWNPAGTLTTDTYSNQKWQNGGETWEQKLETEYTTAQVKDQAVAALPAFSGVWQPGSAGAAYIQRNQKRTADVSKMKYRFRVLGEKDEQYKVWFRRRVYDNAGNLVENKLDSVEATGAGRLTPAYTPEQNLDVPDSPGTITISYVGVTAADDDSPAEGSDAPGGGDVTTGSGADDPTGTGSESPAYSGGGFGGGGGCTSCGSGSSGGNVVIRSGGGATSGLSMRLRRGYNSGGGTMGYLGFEFSNPGWGMYARSALRWNPSVNSDVRYTGGSVCQMLDPQGLIDIVTDSTNKYRICFYRRDQVATTNGALITVVGGAQPHTVWTLENPNAGTTNYSALRITSTNSAGTIRRFDTAFTTNPNAGNQSGWKVESPGDLFEKLVTTGVENTTIDGSPVTLRTEREVWRPVGATNEIRVVLRKFRAYAWGEGLVEEVFGVGGDAKTNTYTYATDTKAARQGVPVETVTRWDGTWEKRQYDSSGRLTHLYTGYETGGPSMSGSGATYRLTHYIYAGTAAVAAGGNPSDNATLAPDLPRVETEYANTLAVRRTIHAYLSNEHQEIRCLSADGTYNAAGNLVTITKYHPSGTYQGRTERVIHPDGTVTLYGYAGTAGAPVETVATGQPDGTVTGASRILNGTLTTTTFGSLGQVQSRVQNDLQAGNTNQTVASETYSLPDEFSRWTRVTYLDGTYTERTFGCCGLTTTTDREGVVTDYFYDSALRLTATRRLGITVTNLLDLDNRVLERRRLGTDGSSQIHWQGLYNTAGFLTRETNAFQGVTTYLESTDGSSRRIRTITYPDTGTRVETYHRDGSLYRVTGTAVPGMEYHLSSDYVYRTNPTSGESIRCERRDESVLDAAGDPTGEVTYTYTDSRGFVFRRDNAAAKSRFWYYNSAGQLEWETDEDGVVTRHTYDARGEREYSGVDINADGSLTTASIDRLAYSKSYYTNVSSVNWRYSVAREFPTGGSATSLITRERWETLDGLETRDVSYGLTNRTTTAINRGTQTRTVNRYAPDGSYVTDVFVGGRLNTSTRYNSAAGQIGKTTLGYDAHGRRSSVLDARNGTTSFAYNGADTVTGVTTPAPGNGDAPQTTTTQYNSSGRAWKVIQPDGTSVTHEFYFTGQLKKTSGSRTYPVEYTYDAAGRMKTMKTWRNFAGNAGAAVTTWNYDIVGRLDTKVYADSSYVDYGYTAAGRLKTRTWARNVTTTWHYDFEDSGLGRKAGDLVKVSYDDATTPEVRYAYDRRGRRTGTEQWSYGGGSQLTATALTLHDSGLPTLESHTAGPINTMSLTLGYDSLLRRTNLVAKQNSTTYVLTNRYGYDTASRLNLLGNGTSDVGYTYAANSSLAETVTHSQGGSPRLTTTRQFDYLNRLLNVSAAASGSGQPTLGSGYVYNAANQRTRQRLGDGSYWVYEYDSLGQVTAGKRYWADGSAVTGQQFEYGFDDIGNRSSAKTGGDTAGANLRNQDYTVNSLNLYTLRTNPRYLEVQGSAQATATVTVDGSSSGVTRQGEYFRKEFGSIAGTGALWQSLTVAVTGGTSTGSKSLFLPPASESYTHDADGNLTADGQWTYGWDAENRLVAVASKLSGSPAVPLSPTSLARRVTYQYDGQGRLLERVEYGWNSGANAWSTTPSNTTRYLYDGWDCVAEFSVSGSTVTHQRSYVWGLDLSGSHTGAGGVGGLVTIYQAPMSSPTAYFTAYDGNGNVAGLVKASDGTVCARYEYGPFGEPLRATGDTIATANPWRFSTKRTDPITALVHYEYRVYQPTAGRWLSRDPIEENGGKNLDCFVYNKPTSYIDTDGRYGWSDIQSDWNDIKNCGKNVWDRTAGIWDNAVFLKDWIANQGSDDREYNENERLTRLLMESNGAKDMASKYSAANCPPTFSGSYGTIQGYKDTIFNWGCLNPAEWQIGGYLYTITKIGPCKVKYTVVNYATRRSLFGEPTIRGWANKVGIDWTPWGLDPRDQVSWGGAIKQTFTWTDVSPCCCGKKKTRQE